MSQEVTVIGVDTHCNKFMYEFTILGIVELIGEVNSYHTEYRTYDWDI